MSMGFVAAAAVGVTAATVAVQAHQANKAAKAQKEANRQALEASQRQAELADQANNRLNGKRPNMAAISAANTAGRGAGSTMLTGPGGVDPNTLTLGRNTLLGS